jgi:hypothetical protein
MAPIVDNGVGSSCLPSQKLIIVQVAKDGLDARRGQCIRFCASSDKAPHMMTLRYQFGGDASSNVCGGQVISDTSIGC